MTETFIVVCRADRTPEGDKGRYELATRTVFADVGAAALYLDTIADSREPLIVSGDFVCLRHGEERGTEDYWSKLLKKNKPELSENSE